MKDLRHILLALLLAPIGLSTACGDNEETPEVIPEPDGANPDPFPVPDPATFPVDEPVDILQSFAEQTCTIYCVHQDVCGEGGDSCLDDCLQMMEADAGQAEIHCTIQTECGEARRCEGGEFASDRDCVALCDRVGDCDGFPSETFGPDEATCVQGCSGYVHARPEARESELSCYYGLMRNNCQLDNAGQCQLDLGEDDLCSQMCGNLIDGCNAIPGPAFLTVQDCLQTCRTAPITEQITMSTCASTAGCDLYDRCFPVLETTPEACPEFCTALDAKCPGAIDPAACPAYCTGVKQALPGADLPGAAQCIDAAPECPGDDTFLCLLPDFEGCDDICTALDVCGADVNDCDTGCAFLAAQNPDAMAGLHTCVTENECNTLGVCFQ